MNNIDEKTRSKIINCVLDYVEGWYSSNDNRMEKALSGKLVKRRYLSENETWEVNKEWMINATKEGNGKIDFPDKGRKEITIFDVTSNMATVKLTSEEFDDYLHLCKSGDEWKIVNALWDYINNEKV